MTHRFLAFIFYAELPDLVRDVFVILVAFV